MQEMQQRLLEEQHQEEQKRELEMLKAKQMQQEMLQQQQQQQIGTSTTMAGQPNPMMSHDPMLAHPRLLSGKPSAWSGQITITRSGNKKIQYLASLVHGSLQGVELMLKSMANDPNQVLNISHRIPFDELSKPERVIMTVLSLQPSSDRVLANDYQNYFREKMRAGSVKLGEAYSLYIIPPLDGLDGPSHPNWHIYCLNPDIPRGSLIAVVCKVVLDQQSGKPKAPEVAQSQKVPMDHEMQKRHEVGGVPATQATSEIMDMFSGKEFTYMLGLKK